MALIIGEVGLIFIPTIFFTFLFKLDFRKDLFFKFPSKKNILITILIAFPLLIIIYFLTNFIGYFVKIPPYYENFLIKLVSFHSESWLIVVFTIALIPAFVEELFFRGFLLSMFNSQKNLKSIIFVALLFALFHLDIFRFFQIFLIGILLGVFYKYSKSFFITFLLHFMTNFLTILSANLPSFITEYPISENMKIASLLLSLIFFFVLLYFFIKINRIK